jgi:hypothetical protein
MDTSRSWHSLCPLQSWLPNISPVIAEHFMKDVLENPIRYYSFFYA